MVTYNNQPIVEQRVDPFIYMHTYGYYYFTTYDGLDLRKAKTISELQGAKTHNVWFKHESGQMSQHIWRPKFITSMVNSTFILQPVRLTIYGNYVLMC